MKNRVSCAVLFLLMTMFCLVFFSMQTKSPTCDEFAHHTASGYSHLVTGDFRMNPAEPPLSRLLSAVPLYFLGVRAPLENASWEKGDSPTFANHFFYQPGFSQDQIIFWARLPILIVSLCFAFFVFIWARDLFGDVGGLVALALFVFCPDILAHSGLATSDICIALFFYLTLWRFWKYLKKQSRKNLILTGVMTGFAFLSKFSAIMLLPTLLLVTILTGSWKKISLLRTLYFLSVVLMTIWSGYFFEMKPLLKNTPDPSKKEVVYRRIGGEPLVKFAAQVPVPLSTFTSAFGSMMMTRAKGTNAYFMGEWSYSQKSWWAYYLTAFSIKNTVPFLIMALASLICFKKIKTNSTSKTFLWLPIALFFIVTMGDRAQAGIRYFLPIYPLFFVLCGGWAAWIWGRGKLFRMLLIALVASHALLAIRAYPDYLSYFNEFIGGPDRGWKYLRDSNLDWGQDLKGLARWANENQCSELVLTTISPVDIKKAYGIGWRTPTQAEMLKPQALVYAFGVHSIDGIGWESKFAPTKIIGHSVWVYDFRKK